jgi:hypothetical protein
VCKHLPASWRFSDATRHSAWRPGPPLTHLAWSSPTCWQTETFLIFTPVRHSI